LENEDEDYGDEASDDSDLMVEAQPAIVTEQRRIGSSSS
jgi:hypothetical protein